MDPARPRYFTDSGGAVIYLSGAHVNNNFIDRSDQAIVNFSGYLDFLQEHNLNFARLWIWEQAAWTHESAKKVEFDPLPYPRTGPGQALDGKPKFDLTRFDQAYFDRLRARVAEAHARGIYVSVMLFQGFSSVPKTAEANPWPGHPFHRDNNINGIDGDPSGDGRGEEVHSLKVPEITTLQEDYLRKVVDTLNGFDNVLYEISGEAPASSKEWQYRMINYLKSYQKTKTYQHPVGISYFYRGTDEDLFASPADWVVLPGSSTNPPPAAGGKVIVSDMSRGILAGKRPWQWVWKSFMSGYNPIYTDSDPFDANLNTAVRQAFGDTSSFARLFDVGSLTPRSDLCSSGYCLVYPGFRYLVYFPSAEPVTVDLSAGNGNFSVSWLNPLNGQSFVTPSLRGGGTVALRPPFQGDAVLYLAAESQSATPLIQSTPQTPAKALTLAATNANFSLSTVGALALTAGSSATANITATLLASSSFRVSFSVSGLPSGASASFSRNSCRPTCTTGLTIKTSASTPSGSYTFTVTGKSNKGSVSTSIVLSVSGAAIIDTVATPAISPNGGSFNGSTSVTLQTSTAGASIYYTTDGTSVSESSRPYTGAITLTSTTLLKAKAFKSGFNPSSEAGAWFNITIPFDFSLTSGGNPSVTAGSAVSNSINVSLISGSTQAVSLTASGLPAGATASFSTASCSPTCSSILTIDTGAATPAGSFTITVTGSGGGVSKTTTFTLSVTAPVVTTPGLVAHWKFDEGSGASTADASGNGNLATLANGPAWGAGVAGKALYFDGTDDNLVVAHSSSLNLSGAFSISAWVNPASTFAGFRSILVKNYTYYLYAGVAGYCGNGSPLGGFLQASDVTVCHASPLPANTWSHIAVTYDGAMLTLYRDGVMAANTPASGGFSTSSGSLQIGASQYGEYFHGLIDEVRVYNKPLTAAEVQTVYQQDKLLIAPSGQIYYVATAGSDSNPGSITQPFRTIAKGLSALKPKDKLYIRGGTYAEAINSNFQTIPTGTSWSDAPVIAAYPGETVVLRPDGGGEVVNLAHSYIQYVIFDGFVIDAANVSFAVSGWGGAHHVRFKNGVIKNASKSGVLLTQGSGLSSDYFEFINMKIHNNGSSLYDHGLYIATSHNLVEGCDIYGNVGYGIHIYNGTPGEQASHNVLRGNTIHHNALTDVSSAGIILSSGDGNIAYNNIIRNNSYGISVSFRATHSKVYNNVVYANTYYGIEVAAGSTAAQVKNNIVYENGWTILDIGSSTVMSTNMTTDPLFVNPLAQDFRLQPNSLAINAGVTLPEVATDLIGVPRPQYGAYDIGAYEFQ
jgi:hypothetical protein